MSSSFHTIGDSFACAISLRLIPITYKYPVGSTVYICKKASKEGDLEPITIASVEFIKNRKLSYPSKNAYLILYNGIYYEDQLCDETSAITLAINYWTAQEELILSQLTCGGPC